MVRKKELSKYEKMKDYWMTSFDGIDCISKINENNEPIEKGYSYENRHIKKVIMFENGKVIGILKRFEGYEMTEVDDNGSVIYRGGYADDITNDYPREGQGAN